MNISLRTKETGLFLLVYAVMRLLSFLLAGYPLASSLVAGVVLLSFITACIRRPHLAEWILICELLLGGNGHFFEFFGLSLRTLLLCMAVLAWLALPLLRERWTLPKLPRRVWYAAGAFTFFLALSIIRGLWLHHGLHNIYSDAIPFAFFFLVLPLRAWYASVTKERIQNLVMAFAAGTALFTLLTFVGYATHFFALQDTYYHWFRDFALGKITDLGDNFYRVVLPEHLLIIPLLLCIKSYAVIHKKLSADLWIITLCLLCVLALDISRTYILALLFGMLFTFKKINIKEWFISASIICLGFFLFFTLFHTVASGFRSPGWELLGIRFGSIVSPTKETSASIRMAILPVVLSDIKENLAFGQGLGATLEIKYPQTNAPTMVTTFDWGYFELLVKLGLFGFLAYIAILLQAIIIASRKASSFFMRHAILASGASLFAMTVFSSALFHVLGIFFFCFVFILAFYIKDPPEQLGF